MAAVLLLLTCPITQQHPDNPDPRLGGGALSAGYWRAPSLRQGHRKGDPPHCFPGCLRTVAGAVSRETGCGMVGLSRVESCEVLVLVGHTLPIHRAGQEAILQLRVLATLL